MTRTREEEKNAENIDNTENIENTDNRENIKNTDNIGCAEAAAQLEAADTEESRRGACGCGHYKLVPRDAAGQKQLTNRLNRIIGQLNGIGKMIEDNRYCGDILIQIGAVESALQSLGYRILQEHMQTCVVDEVKKGNEEIMEETIELIRKLK